MTSVAPLARLRAAVLAGLVAIGLAWAAPATAQISPGPLSRAHQKLEGNSQCLQCHRSGKGVDRVLCLKCHVALGQRIAARQGLHARAEYAACEHCHSEHNGAAFELVFWGSARRSGFDHKETGFPLVGKHAGLECEKCHRADKVSTAVRTSEPTLDASHTFLGLGKACTDCHADPHRGQLAPAACTDCHSQEGWKPAAGFDHARTRYELTGAHAKAPCLKCHVQQPGAGAEKALVLSQFKGTALPACVRCHADAHRGKLGTDCAHCHDTSSFKSAQTAGFDHERTAYPLRGRHRPVACAKCHTTGRETRVAGFERCETCHVDAHLGQLAKAGGSGGCSSCHNVDGFAPALYGPDQHGKSAFALHGAHLAVPCVGCHRKVAPGELPRGFMRAATAGAVTQFKFATAACRDCHKDPHGGQFDRYAKGNGCAACHDDESWRGVRFDHEQSAYPLRGKHREVACALCHPRTAERPAAGTVGLKLSGLAKDCAGCHRDAHAGQLAKGNVTACERCHVVEDFHKVSFDHQHDATYQLDGAHIKVACAGCHPTERVGDLAVVRYKPLPHTCDGCHKNDNKASARSAIR